MEKCVRSLYENRIFRVLTLLVLGIMAAISIAKGVSNAYRFSQDFQWDAAKALSLGINPYTVSLTGDAVPDDAAFQDYYAYYESIDAPQKMEANQFPSLLMLLLPYAFLAPGAARIAWIVTNLLCSAGIIWLLRRTFFARTDGYLFAVLSLLMLAGTPYRNQLGVGQHTLFSFFFFLLAVFLAQKKNGSIPAALCLAVSYFKYTLTAPLALYFVYKRKWKELILSVAVHVIATVGAAFWLHESVIDMILQPLKVSSALIAEGGMDLGALLNGSGAAFLLAALIMAGLFVIALRADENSDGMLISVLLLWSLIILYHRIYDFFPLILVAASFCDGNATPDQKGNRAMVCFYALLVLFMFFIMRLLGEERYVWTMAACLYYTFTIILTVLLIIQHTGIKHHGNEK